MFRLQCNRLGVRCKYFRATWNPRPSIFLMGRGMGECGQVCLMPSWPLSIDETPTPWLGRISSDRPPRPGVLDLITATSRSLFRHDLHSSDILECQLSISDQDISHTLGMREVKDGGGESTPSGIRGRQWV